MHVNDMHFIVHNVYSRRLLLLCLILKEEKRQGKQQRKKFHIGLSIASRTFGENNLHFPWDHASKPTLQTGISRSEPRWSGLCLCAGEMKKNTGDHHNLLLTAACSKKVKNKDAIPWQVMDVPLRRATIARRGQKCAANKFPSKI